MTTQEVVGNSLFQALEAAFPLIKFMTQREWDGLRNAQLMKGVTTSIVRLRRLPASECAVIALPFKLSGRLQARKEQFCRYIAGLFGPDLSNGSDLQASCRKVHANELIAIAVSNLPADIQGLLITAGARLKAQYPNMGEKAMFWDVENLIEQAKTEQRKKRRRLSIVRQEQVKTECAA